LGIGRWPYQLAQDQRRRSIWFLVNKVESKSEKELSPDTVQTLNQLFSMTLQEQQFLATQNPFQRKLCIRGHESPKFKFLHYVPMSETSRQSQTHNSSISPSKSSNKGVQKRHRRFLQHTSEVYDRRNLQNKTHTVWKRLERETRSEISSSSFFSSSFKTLNVN